MYRLKLKSKQENRTIFLFGSIHTFNYKHKQFIQLEKFWAEFLSLTFLDKRIVFIEGGIRPHIKNRSKAIERDGEAGLITLLAKKEGVKATSPEPESKHERRLLEKKFTKEEIELYYFARYVYQWNLYTKKPKFEIYIKEFLSREKKESGWHTFEFSLPIIKEIFFKNLGRPFDHKDFKYLYSITNPYKNKSIVNKISKESGNIRDNYIAERIIEQWRKNISTFVVYGSGHIPVIKKIIRSKIKLPKV